ncbi:MAG: amino acid permease [Candidatus Riflebacteria bacterium]|nr:amino acid permease [Candidatus Riflebacteria bacterium]
MNLFIKKDMNKLIADAGDPHASEGSGTGELRRTLGPVNLIMLGIGAIIGAGIFSLTGTAAANYAGPGIIYSFVLGGILCALAGLCYAEMAAMIPVSGSAYAYSYATMGELVAWIIGWDLILEYAFGAVTVTASWSGYLMSLIHKTLGMNLPDWVMRLTKGPWEQVTLSDGHIMYGFWNLPATFIAIVVAFILYRGIRESATVNNIIVVVKISIVLLFIALGWEVTKSANWIANPDATGIFSLVPLFGASVRDGKEIMSYGWSGVLTGAGVVFFAYIGFDAVSTTAQECKNPTRDLPIGILGSLVVCTVLYILVALVLTGVVPYKELGVAEPIAVGIDAIVAAKGWSILSQTTFSISVKLGALAGLTSVILVMMLGQSRVFYAMAKDGLLPWFDSVHPTYKTPHIATAVNGVFVSLCGGLMPMWLVGELVSIGTLLAFVLVCTGVLILRFTNPLQPRPFRAPMVGVVAPAGALACIWVMSGLPTDTWIRLIVWLIIGFTIYFTYGINNSRLRVRA